MPGARAIGHALVALGVDLASVKAGFRRWVREQIEGCGRAFEAVFSGLVTGANIGVQLFGQAAIRLADIVRGGGSAEA
jgi:hypothetical protein